MGLLPGNRLGHHPFPHRSLYPLTGCNLLPLLWRGCLPALFRFHLVFSSHLRSIIEQSLSPLLSSLLKSIFHERLRHSSPRYVTNRFAPLRCLFSIDVSSCRSRRIPDVLFFLSTGNSPPSFPVSFPLSPGHPPSQWWGGWPFRYILVSLLRYKHPEWHHNTKKTEHFGQH
jgi:hypothetical protein